MSKIDWKKYTSTEFLLSLLTMVGGWLTYLGTNLDAKYAAYMTAGAAIIFALSRGLAKFNTDLKSGWKTREFWLAIAGIAVVILTAIPGVISPEAAVASSVAIVAGYGVSRGFAKNPLDEVTGSGEQLDDVADDADVVL